MNNQSTILIIEDDPTLGELLSTHMNKKGILFELVTKGEEGLAIAEQCSPALIILDLLLPDMSGYEVLEQLKNRPSLSSIPVIILSNLSQEDEKRSALALGARDFLVKSEVDLDRVVEVIGAIIR